MRLKMQVERFRLFRQDIRDMVELTVQKMDLYHMVGASLSTCRLAVPPPGRGFLWGILLGC